MEEIQRMQYGGNDHMHFHMIVRSGSIAIKNLLKFESTTPIEEIIESSDELRYYTKLSPELLVTYNDIRRFMSTCRCVLGELNDLERQFLELTGIPIPNHREWRECLAFKVFEHIIRGYGQTLYRILDGTYIDDRELISDFFVFASLGYPQILNIVPPLQDFTLLQLMELARGYDNNDECTNLTPMAAVMIYRMQQVGRITKSARS